jgi:hypothetical protein
MLYQLTESSYHCSTDMPGYVIPVFLTSTELQHIEDAFYNELLNGVWDCGTTIYWHFTPTGLLKLNKHRGDPDMRHVIDAMPTITDAVDRYLSKNPDRLKYENSNDLKISGGPRYIVCDVARQIVNIVRDKMWAKLEVELTNGDHVSEQIKVTTKALRQAESSAKRLRKQLSALTNKH